jgi:PAT family acetyl-CoA transporter-like MFS transporter 1
LALSDIAEASTHSSLPFFRAADVQKFILLHLIAKIGFMANDSVTSLKLLEKGLLKEDMAVAVLIDFPFQIIGGWCVPLCRYLCETSGADLVSSVTCCRLAASWSTGPRPLTPWMTAYTVRLGFGLLAIALVAGFPSQTPIPYAYFLLVVGFTVLGSFTRCVPSQLLLLRAPFRAVSAAQTDP